MSDRVPFECLQKPMAWLRHPWANRDFTNQNATQFENTETEKGPGRERCHERGKNKVTDANATTEAELCKSFNLR